MNLYEAFKTLEEDTEVGIPESPTNTLLKNIVNQIKFPGEPDVTIDYAAITESDEGTFLVPVELRTVTLPVSCVWEGDSEGNYSTDDIDIDAEKEAENYIKNIQTPVEFAEGVLTDVSYEDIHDYTITDTEVTKVTEEDAGIGSYEYWGTVGYDSQPYTEISGVVTIDAVLGLWLEIAIS